MPIVVVPANLAACQVEFPEGVERSVKGALYVRPASTLEITQAELEYLRKEKKDLVAKLIVVGETPSLASKLAARAAQDPALKKMLDDEANAAKAEAMPAAELLPPVEAPLKAKPKKTE